ncbi:hypothetical protein BDN70DRAFT_845003, partial [Pholiota conissans]
MPFRQSVNIFLAFGLLALKIALAFPIGSVPSCDESDSSQSLALFPVDLPLHDPRSVWNIVWSCVTTIVACCWVAVHPNMLAEDASRWQVFVHRLKHMAWMIVAPELIICWAIRQWVGARNLMMQEPFAQHNNDKKDQKEKQWTITHGLFLQMGGFVLKITKSPATPDQSTEEVQILTVECLKALVLTNEISLPIIDAREINDRSKRDEFSKTIAIGQTSWFLAQCLTRKAQGLVTTELELVTIAFAALNVFIYYFWLNKPLDPRTTVKVMIMQKQKEAIRDSGVIPSSVSPTSYHPKSEPSISKDAARPSNNRSKPMLTRFWVAFLSFLVIILRKIGMILIVLPLQLIVPLFHGFGSMRLFHRLSSMLLFKEIMSMLFETPEIKHDAKKIPTFYAKSTGDYAQHMLILVGVGAIGGFFGGIHCIGWNYFFLSHAEVIIWRVSSILITAVPGIMAIAAIALYIGATQPAFCNIGEFVGGLLLIVAAAGTIPYLVARILLLVEAFISLRDLPPTALLAVRWTSFLPHV